MLKGNVNAALLEMDDLVQVGVNKRGTKHQKKTARSKGKEAQPQH